MPRPAKHKGDGEGTAQHKRLCQSGGIAKATAPALAEPATEHTDGAAATATTYTCGFCGKVFATLAGHKYHVNKQVCPESRASGDAPGPAGPAPEKTDLPAANVAAPTTGDDSEPHICTQCGKSFKSTGGLAYHVGNNVCQGRLKRLDKRNKAPAAAAKQSKAPRALPKEKVPLHSRRSAAHAAAERTAAAAAAAAAAAQPTLAVVPVPRLAPTEVTAVVAVPVPAVPVQANPVPVVPLAPKTRTKASTATPAPTSAPKRSGVRCSVHVCVRVDGVLCACVRVCVRARVPVASVVAVCVTHYPSQSAAGVHRLELNDRRTIVVIVLQLSSPWLRFAARPLRPLPSLHALSAQAPTGSGGGLAVRSKANSAGATSPRRP
jgi:hypothetical protein